MADLNVQVKIDQNKIYYTSNEDKTLWYKLPVILNTDYELKPNLIGIVPSKCLIDNNVMLINNLFSSIIEPGVLKLHFYNLDERPFTFKKGQEIGTIIYFA